MRQPNSRALSGYEKIIPARDEALRITSNFAKKKGGQAAQVQGGSGVASPARRFNTMHDACQEKKQPKSPSRVY